MAQAAGMGADDARYLLTRTGFAPTPAEIARYAVLSRDEGVEQILDGVRTAPDTALPKALDDYVPPVRMRTLSEDERRELNRLQLREKGMELRAWWLGEMLHTSSPLTERMTLFWHNHFVSSQEKVKSAALMLDQNLLLRRFAVGNFGVLLHEVSKDTAMMLYLDAASNRKGQPNENFAREVMELFTLGEGHYTESDIKEAARAFTGWTIDPATGLFEYRHRLHDDGVKTIFGRTGKFDGDDVLDLLLARPETAQFISVKLWHEFGTPALSQADVDRVATALRQSRYEMRPALLALFTSDTFWAPSTRGALAKSPVDLVVGALRSMQVDANDPMPYVRTLRQLGQDLFAPPNVKGWPGNDTWINTATLLSRKQFLDRLARSDRLGASLSGSTQMAVSDKGNVMSDWSGALGEAGLTPAQVLLVVPPVEADPRQRGAAGLRALLLDPAYEVK
ncbi:MAG: DUF1800 domain-containing protein [Rhodocyclaceae bacterium]